MLIDHLLSSMYFSRTDVLGCAGTLKVATLPRVRTLDHANPRKGLRANPAGTPKVATLPRVRALDHANPRKKLCFTHKKCNFISRSRARPRQSTQKVAREPKNPKSSNFTSRSRARPRQSTQRVAFPIDGIGAGSGFRKIDIPRCR